MAVEWESMQSNLDCLLRCITPVVPSQSVPKSEIRDLNRLWHPWERERVEFFVLGDLWKRYDEWSAYGAGVPIVLNQREALVQYYVPYLSAVQVYTSGDLVNSFREETESWDFSSSNSCSDESEGSEKLSRLGHGGRSLLEDRCDGPEHLSDRLGCLYYQYYERSAPCARVPLMDKINELSQKHPGLLSLRSVDLSPASWMAVAWYPIYHIPMGRTIKDLSTCFLTYHTLSSSFQDMEDVDEIEWGETWKVKGREGVVALPPFGLATYKMQGDVWASGRHQERLASLSSVAGSWLKQLQVQHHDFDYFTGQRRA
ncbi:hypothetical protein MLD38_030535 [Melastoma candidum]|uniref:Uncharacterized protein n=1 Tax=Melastoma candidum TaxID=119954 RepID=A0ACB9MQJ7_9MYRT|nr:hypothetical protein MLD38_030535 [Melastoma candidum]